jgi:hypothetical protein
MPVNKTAQTLLKSFFLLLVVDILAHGNRTTRHPDFAG